MELDFHGTDDRLEQYAFGRLPASELPSFEEHLLICPECLERLDGIADFAIAMQDALTAEAMRAESVPARQTDWFAWLRKPVFSMGLAFAALILVIGIVSTGRTKFAPVASLQLMAMRGEMPFTVPAKELDLTLSDGPREGGPFRVEVVDATGSPMWSGPADTTPAGVQVKVQHRLGPGDYFVRLYTASGKMLHEYGFRIRA